MPEGSSILRRRKHIGAGVQILLLNEIPVLRLPSSLGPVVRQGPDKLVFNSVTALHGEGNPFQSHV